MIVRETKTVLRHDLLSREEIRQLLGLQPWWQWEVTSLGRQMLNLNYSMEMAEREQYRQSGRTTRACIEACYAIFHGRTIIHIVALNRQTCKCIEAMVQSMLQKLEYNDRDIKFYARASSSNLLSGFDIKTVSKTDFYLIDHTLTDVME